MIWTIEIHEIPWLIHIEQGDWRTIGTLGLPWFVMGCEVLMTSGDLENSSRSTKFNKFLALPNINLNMKYESHAIKTMGCRAITWYGGREISRQAGREGQTKWVMTISSRPKVKMEIIFDEQHLPSYIYYSRNHCTHKLVTELIFLFINWIFALRCSFNN